MNKQIQTKDLFDCRVPHLKKLFDECKYPWEMIPRIKEYITLLIENGIEGYTLIGDDVLVGESVKIHPSATIIGPTIIGSFCEVRPGAFIRGSVITGEGCVIGNSTELKNCVLLDGAQLPHYNYVGDSILGNKAHLGAGAICSNLRSDGQSVIIHGDSDYKTNLRKLGGILGDGADIGCGSVINPGTIIGKSTTCYPLTSLRGVYPADCIIKSTKEVVKRIKNNS